MVIFNLAGAPVFILAFLSDSISLRRYHCISIAMFRQCQNKARCAQIGRYGHGSLMGDDD